MGSRSSSSHVSIGARGGRAARLGRVALAALAALLWVAAASLSGCGKNAVRASEKEFLADQTMVFDSDPQEAAADDHVAANREGSAGGRGTSGGGCGCN